MKPTNDPLSLNGDSNNNGDVKCCNCEVELTPENEVTHIPSYLSSTPGELIKIRDAVLIVFEGDIRAKGFSFEANEKVAMCAECTPSFIDMYNAYTKFMGMTKGSSWLKATIKESLVWKEKYNEDVCDESEEDSEVNSTPLPKDGNVPVRFEKVKIERNSPKKSKPTEETVESDGSETIILPDLNSSPTSTPSTKRKRIENIPEETYNEKFANIILSRLTEKELKTAGNFITFSQIKTETDVVKFEMDVGVKDLIKNEEAGGEEKESSPKIIRLQSSTTATAESSKFYSGHRCPACTRLFSCDKILIQHYDAVHKPHTPQFTCQFCNQQFVEEWFYENHIENLHHGIQLTFACQLCSEVFADVTELDQHKQICEND